MKKFFAAGCFVLLAGVSAISFGQARDPEAAAAIASSVPSLSVKKPIAVDLSRPVQMTVGSSTVFDLKTGGVVGETREQPGGLKPNIAMNLLSGAAGTIDGLDTVDTFDGAFAAQNGPSTGNVFRFSMMGNSPMLGGETDFPTKIDEISLTLLNEDGSTFTNVPFDPFSGLTLRSPNFGRHPYSSGVHIQYADAVQRAEFFHHMRSNWHTNLDPSVINRVNIAVPKFVNVQLPSGKVVTARAYFAATAADGSTVVFMLDLLFNFFFGNEVINDINAGSFTTNALNMTLFPNTYLFSLNIKHPKSPGQCCVLGFHTYFYDPTAVPQPRWITIFASWISPGIFPGFQDVTGLSHEISESFNDPFGDNLTPIWQFPGVPAKAKICGGDLEVGDPIEFLANPSTPITIGTFTYHPQNVALLQWFEMGKTSNALDGAFSFPEKSVLPTSAVPCPK